MNATGPQGPLEPVVRLGTAWAYAPHEYTEDWCVGFDTREQAVAELLEVYPEGGWVAQTRDVEEDDEDVQEDHTVLCILETYERVGPNAPFSGERSESAGTGS